MKDKEWNRRALVELVKRGRRNGRPSLNALAEMIECYWLDSEDSYPCPEIITRAANALKEALA